MTGHGWGDFLACPIFNLLEYFHVLKNCSSILLCAKILFWRVPPLLGGVCHLWIRPLSSLEGTCVASEWDVWPLDMTFVTGILYMTFYFPSTPHKNWMLTYMHGSWLDQQLEWWALNAQIFNSCSSKTWSPDWVMSMRAILWPSQWVWAILGPCCGQFWDLLIPVVYSQGPACLHTHK